MITSDLIDFVSKQIEVTIYRRHRSRMYSGRLISISKNFICLCVDGDKEQWIQKPNRYKDSVEEVDIK